MNQNRPYRSGLTPEQERRRAEWAQYAAREQQRRQAMAAERRRMEAERARREEAERKAARAKARRLFFNRFLIYLAVLAILLAVMGALFILSLHRVDRPAHPDTVTYTLGGQWDDNGKVIEQPTTLTLDYAEAVTDSVTYFPMTALADLLGLSITGSPDVQKFSTQDGEYVRFTADSATAEVNGEPHTLDAPVRLRKDDGIETLWIPLSFVTDWMQGVTVTWDSEAGTVSVKPDTLVSPAFAIKSSAPAANIDEQAEFGNTPAIEFKADLSAYEEYMNPADRNAYVTLVNVEHKLAADYIPPDLTNITNTRKDGRNTQQMREYAARALEAFFLEMKANGITDVSVTSGYRSYAYQEQLFEQRVAMYPSLSREDAEAKAATVVTYPGSSEHQSGLCIDMHNLSSADIKFGQTAAFDWISQNAHKFGFILRYPEDKVAVTGISYEPWHYRYVGRYHATRIYENGLCLEEYVARLGLGSAPNTDLSGDWRNSTYERCTLTASPLGTNSFAVTVRWSSSVSDYTRWDMQVTYDPTDGLYRYTGGRKQTVAHDAAGTETAKTVYTNGSGTLSLRDGSLVWHDAIEGTCDNIPFARE